jgi:hypothetical protein
MQFEKTLKTLLRAKQEGQNDSYKAGFNDALNLLEQEEDKIILEVLQKRPLPTFMLSGGPGTGNVTLPKAIAQEEEGTKKTEVSQTAQDITQALSTELKTLVEPVSDIEPLPTVEVKTEAVSLSVEELQANFSSSIVTDKKGERTKKTQNQHSDPQKDQDKDVDDVPHETEDEHLGEASEEMTKEQRQLEALALARQKAKEDDEGEDDE